ncbi:NAD(P)-binding protein [Penicillium maclennaniae]|uniref:NAD(P)-binding protein n=1 Tax=Penicillium maclennaniae TaxID=1343394 RepID=UPI002541DE7E|nr:NAD(P)-binding protein [Penicillium maclennaniae]KAJ5662295.1 NAD(P)-binding protein [Penicillium maclennaniae]
MSVKKVLIVGAAGATGSSIANGLLESTTKFVCIPWRTQTLLLEKSPRSRADSRDIYALTRPSSIQKPENQSLKERGVNLVAADLKGPHEELVKILTGIDVVISAVGADAQLDQLPLVTAAKAAGVERFIPCGFITVAPPKGVMTLREQKEVVYNHIREIGLPFTIIDVGWWYQVSFPKLPSGRIDYASIIPVDEIVGDGNMPSALTDVRDIGRYVARIIVDPRTLNKMILAYNEVFSQNEIYDLLESLGGEKLERKYVSGPEVHGRLAAVEKAIEGEASPTMRVMMQVLQYQISWGLRGDNTPENAKRLGYMTSKELYPDFEFVKFGDYLKEVIDGKASHPYQNRDLSDIK